MNYPISENLRSALRKIFDDESVAYGLLGQGIPFSQREVLCTSDMEPAQRIRILIDRLESFIVQMANELSELGPDELPRMRAEATAILLTLREIQSHFPEIIGESQGAT